MLSRSLIVIGWLFAHGVASTAMAQAPDVIDAVSASNDKAARLLKLQRLNRVFQVVYGRSLKKSEASGLLDLQRAEIKSFFLQGSELKETFAKRLTAYAMAGDGTSILDIEASPVVLPLADPTKKLSKVLTSVNSSARGRGQDLSRLTDKRHQGVQCSSKSPSVCFARWLTGRIAPGLGPEWLSQHEQAIPNMTYATLLEKIVLASIEVPS